MKITEYVEKATSKGYMPATIDQQNEKIKKDLNVKSYLGIKDKKTLIQDIVDDTIIYNNGLYKFNGIDQYIIYTMKSIAVYTALELSDDVYNDYDILCSTGLLAKILRTFDEEYQSVLSLLKMQCDYVLMDNSVTARFNTLFNAATVGVNKLSDSFNESLKNIKQEDVQKFFNLLSKIK